MTNKTTRAQFEKTNKEKFTLVSAFNGQVRTITHNIGIITAANSAVIYNSRGFQTLLYRPDQQPNHTQIICQSRVINIYDLLQPDYGIFMEINQKGEKNE